MIHGNTGHGSERFESEERLILVELNSRISVTLSSEERAHKIDPGLGQECHIIEPHREHSLVVTAENSVSFSLEDMFHFDDIMQKLVQQQARRIVVCTGVETNRQARTLMLLGCHMVMSQGMGFEEAFLIFRPLHSMLEIHLRGTSAFEIVLRAMCCAKCLSWINFGPAPENGIQMDEFIHYARFALPLSESTITSCHSRLRTHTIAAAVTKTAPSAPSSLESF